jgi:hypothetical protein
MMSVTRLIERKTANSLHNGDSGGKKWRDYCRLERED